MTRTAGWRTILSVCVALVALLGVLAVVQYRSSGRVAAADLQREREHLESGATLFTSEFDAQATAAYNFIQSYGPAALSSAEALPPLPKLLSEVCYIETRDGHRQARRLGPANARGPIEVPAELAEAGCAAPLNSGQWMRVPVYDVSTHESAGPQGRRVLQTFQWRSDRCFAARLDLDYLRSRLLPDLLARAFGSSVMAETDFEIAGGPRSEAIYGRVAQPELARRFFAVASPLPQHLPPPAPGHGKDVLVRGTRMVMVQGGPAEVFGPGLWELRLAHRGSSLAEAFERARWRDLGLLYGVETLFVAALLVLVVGLRRRQQLADQKVRFVAGVSHELRAPVSAISMLSRNQADGLVTGAERVRQYGELMHQQSRRLSEMVEQTLAYAGIHSGQRPLARSEVAVRDVVEAAVDERRAELEQAGFSVEIDVPAGLPVLRVDGNLLSMALDNLLSNALKHAAAGRWLRVTAALAGDGREVVIEVADRGEGITQAEQAELFEPFRRGRAAVDSQLPGSGLGLSLVRGAVEAHGGRVTLNSQPGQGSAFALHIPL